MRQPRLCRSPPQTVKIGTLAGLLRQAEVDVSEFLDLL
jgi:hypothetical protein